MLSPCPLLRNLSSLSSKVQKPPWVLLLAYIRKCLFVWLSLAINHSKSSLPFLANHFTVVLPHDVLSFFFWFSFGHNFHIF